TTTVTLGELFTAGSYTIQDVTVTGGTYTKGATWDKGTVTVTGTGTFTITITDNFYCNIATATVIVEEPDIVPEEKFVKKFNKTDFMYRIGNQNEVAIEKIFVPVDGFVPTNATVTVTPVESSQVTADITATTLKFNGTGVAKVSIVDTADPACLPTELYLEVVDATNVTGANGTISGNVVLVNNAGTNGFTVSGDNTFYGNGFTVSNTNDGRYLGLGSGLKQGIITVKEGGTLENTVVRASIFPIAALYSNQIEDYYEVDSVTPSKVRYYYQLSAVAVSGDSTISNCHIYGARNNLYVGAGNVTVKDSVLEAGVLSNMQIESSSDYTVTLDDITTIQYQNKPTVYANDSLKNNTMLGFGVIVGPNSETNPTLVLKGEFKQYNWINADDQSAVTDSYAQSAMSSALGVSKYQHTVNGKTSVNMGIVFLNTKTATVDNQTGLPYSLGSISVSGVSGQAYSLSGATSDQIFSDYENADKTIATDLYKPQFKFDETLGGQFIENVEGCDEYCYVTGKTVNVLFVDGDTKVLDLAGLVNIEKYTGEDLGMTISCLDENGVAVPVDGTSVSLTNKGTYTVTYTVTDTLFYNKDGQVVADTVTYTFPITLSVSLKDNAVPDARFAFNNDSQKMGYYKPTIGDVKQYLPFLKGLQIYDHNGQSEYLRFNGDSDFNKIASITITGYSSNKALVEVKLTDGGVINTRFLARANSGGASTYTGSIKTKDNTVYFVNGGGTSNSASTTTSAYWYVDYYTFTGNNGVTITSAQQTFNSSGSSVSTPSGSFSTTINATVTYDANGGSCVQTIGYATSVATSVTLPTPKRGGFLFAGWYTAPTGGTRVGGAGESYTPSANVTLYAQWGKPCDVTYDANGGTADVSVQTYTGTALTLPNASRDGYWFLGWYTAPTGGEKIGDAGEGYHPGGAITLYAQWQEAISYTVTYNANSGSVSPASATYEGTALTLPTPTRTGYKFNGWYTAASGGTRAGGAGENYIPTADITLYAQWTGYTVTYNANGGTCGTTSATYAGTALTLPTPTRDGYSFNGWYTAASGGTKIGDAGASYTPTADITLYAQWTEESSGGNCIAPDTLITLADGSQVRVDSLTGDEELLVWNLETGSLDSAPIMFVDSDPQAEVEVVTLTFSDGTDVKVIYEHGFWDYDLNRYVYLDENASEYIGHTFAKHNGDTLEKVQLTDVVLETEVTTAWSPVTKGHLCYFVNGMLSMPGGVGGLFNIFEVNPDTMTYDYEKMAEDIETYGLFTYEELNEIAPLSEAMFEEAGGAYLKISIGKDNLTMEELVAMINRYSKFFE
ncbi:MAG: InlB B-repeat-containing protein, partial [Clostridia bacterium]|nr:InlB B-repeat-containing protein [Clostridia bacterium]